MLNQALRECSFNTALQTSILEYAKVFKAQPLPLGLVPLETNRIILNERLLPGLTKVLQIGDDFPLLSIEPLENGEHDEDNLNLIACK